MSEDYQRRKLFVSEAYVWPSEHNTVMSQDRVQELVDEVATNHLRRLPFIEFGGTHAVMKKDKLVVPDWAQRPLLILHELCHQLVHPIFPDHGAEFAAQLLWLLETYASPALCDDMRRAFDDYGVHYGPEHRRERVRRIAVNASNQSRGVLARLVVDDPPGEIVGPVGVIDKTCGTVEIGDVVVELSRGRYMNLVK